MRLPFQPGRVAIMTTALVMAACAHHPDKHTLASLHQIPADTSEVKVEEGLYKAMQSYRRYLDQTPEGAMTPEAMRRLADLKLEKQFGILGDGKIVEVDAADRVPKVEAPQAAAPAALTAPVHARIDARAADKTDPLHIARAAEITSLWRLAARPEAG